ncbi:hypothetical protein Tco_1319064 [Tanacetum coccineum]
MDQDSAHMVAASKVLILKPENGATLPKTTTVEGVVTEMPITTVEEKAQRRLEDAKKLLEAVEKRFSGNEATKKTQRNLLKQTYDSVNLRKLSSFAQAELPVSRAESKLLLLMAMRTIGVLISPKCGSASICHKRGHFVGVQSSKKSRTTRHGKIKKECACGNIYYIALVSCDVLVDINGSDRQEGGWFPGAKETWGYGRINAIDADEEINLVSVQDDADKEMFDVDAFYWAEEACQCKSSTTTTIYSQQSHDKGKGILIEPVEPIKKKDLTRLDEEVALKLQAEFDEKERLAREKAKKNKKPILP